MSAKLGISKRCIVGVILDESRVIKIIEKLPKWLRSGYSVWRRILLEEGFYGLRKIKGFHFEKLKGIRSGQYSCRLNRGYRVIFIQSEYKTENKVIVIVMEVSKHGY